MRTRLLPLLYLFVVLAAALFVGRLNKIHEDTEQRGYCDMVHLFKQSGGELGWPDYAGTYAELCTADGKVRHDQAP